MAGLYPVTVGIDLSDLVIRVAAIAHHGQSAQLTHFQEIILPPGLLVDGEIQQPGKLSQQLHTLMRHARPNQLTNKECVSSLPDRRTFIKLITVERPPVGVSLATRIEAELVQHIPFSLDEVYFDWQIIDQSSAHARVLVSAAPRDLADSYLGVLQSAGLMPVALETESQAITRAVFPRSLPQTSHMVVDIGGTRTTVVVIGQGTIQFASSLPFSGFQLTQAVAKELHLSLDDAEKAKQLYGLNRALGRGSVGKALLTFLPALTNKLEELQQFYHNHFQPADQVQALTLTGGGAHLQGLPEYLETQLHIPTNRAEPLRALENTGGLPSHRIASFTTVLGLAQRSWN